MKTTKLKFRIFTVDGHQHYLDRVPSNTVGTPEKEAAHIVLDEIWSTGHFHQAGDYLNSTTAIPPWQIKEVNFWVEESEAGE